MYLQVTTTASNMTQKFFSSGALGSRSYAAPEILTGIRNLLTSSTHSRKSDNDAKSTAKKRESLAECVSSYGMTADAFSVGTTIRHMVTGTQAFHLVKFVWLAFIS